MNGKLLHITNVRKGEMMSCSSKMFIWPRNVPFPILQCNVYYSLYESFLCYFKQEFPAFDSFAKMEKQPPDMLYKKAAGLRLYFYCIFYKTPPLRSLLNGVPTCPTCPTSPRTLRAHALYVPYVLYVLCMPTFPSIFYRPEN